MENEKKNFPIQEEGCNSKDLGRENVGDGEPSTVSSDSDKFSEQYALLYNNIHNSLTIMHAIGEKLGSAKAYEDAIAILESHLQKFKEWKLKFKETPAAETSQDDQSELKEEEKSLKNAHL